MSKYNNYYNTAYTNMGYDENNLIRSSLMDGEVVLWQGKPKKKAYIMNSIFTKMFPFALLWLFVDLGIMIPSLTVSGGARQMLFFMIPFFALHLMPVWIWLFGVLRSARKLKYKMYVLTDKRVLIKSESVVFNSIYYSDIFGASVSQGIIDKATNVGDVHIDVNMAGREAIVDIEDFVKVNDILQKKIFEIKTANTQDDTTGFGEYSNGFTDYSYDTGFNNDTDNNYNNKF